MTPLKSRLAVLCFVLVSVPSLAWAQRVEITPSVNYSFGSGFEVDDFDFGFIDIDVDETDGLGLFLDFRINENFMVEVLYSTQETELEADDGLFSESFPIADADIEYLHGGVLFEASFGQVKPYFALTGGLTRIDVALEGADSETYPSLGLGGGVKLMFTRNFGLRADGRFFFTALDENDNFYRRRRDFDCCGSDDTLTQFQGSVGLTFAF
ncbi:MAG: outer membrane beta-barrel protein [Acidobacteriota bacterium]